MARETHVRKIDGFEYTCTQFPPQKALRVLTRLTKHVGEPLAKIMQSADSGKSMLDQDVGKLAIGEALSALGKSMGDDDAYQLCTDIC